MQPYQRIVMFIVSLALFMEALDTTIINTAIPAMSYSLQVNPIDLKISLISYLVSLAVFIPISGWIADRFGIKKIFILAIVIFTASSLWCGYANNLLDLVLARTLQGIGGALALPVGRLILFRTFERHQVVYIMSRVVMIAGLGLMLGPVLGGLITHYFSWPWIFWVNVPVGIIAILLAYFLFQKMPAIPVPPLDKLGFILFGASLASFTFGLSAFSETGFHTVGAFSILAAAIVLMLLYIWHSYHHPHPIVNTKLFHFRSFQVSTIGNLISRLGFGGVPFLLPILLQISLGYSIETSGFLLAPLALGVLLVKPFSMLMLRKLGYRKLLILNTSLVALSLWSFVLVTEHTSIYLIALFTFLFGFLISMQYSAMNSLAYAEISAEQLSAATSIMGTLQQLAASFGVAVSALLIHFLSPTNSIGGFQLTAIIFHQTFFVLGLITLCSIFIFLKLHPEDGEQMIQSKI